ncbi:MAG: 3-dehydroquinate synthase [Parasporobacterium sp.]|nr:3-dehydroquinate synthase [Parasporobacterium sp.]
MKTIHVDASVSYDVLIGEGLLSEAGSRVSSLGNIKHAVIVSDDNVFPLYGNILKESMSAEGIAVDEFIFPHGENSKSIEVYQELLEFLCSISMTRSDVLVALGGGVTGDLTGFAAATYQRGIRFIQVPTTLLAAVDSSVGGKTAVNLRGGKNQVGCFYQPSLVLCDIRTLDTLPEEEFRCGCGEVIKYGMIGDAGFFQRLAETDVRTWITDAIAACVAMKRDVVMRDEFDTGDRMLLNFGHTFAHGVEKLSDFKVPHGMAVAMGMAAITQAAEKLGACEPGTSDRLEEVLKKYGLPLEIEYSGADIAAAAKVDKKSTGSTIRLIIPEKIGSCVIRTVPADELMEWTIAGGMK